METDVMVLFVASSLSCSMLHVHASGLSALQSLVKSS
jgi:hypothetical protein